MLRKLANRLLVRCGYELIRTSARQRQERAGFVLWSYRKPDGSFDYPKYVRTQSEGTRKKIDKVWVQEENIAFLADYLKRATDPPRFGICHGTRRGKEQEWFRRHLGCEVIGTEISEAADRFPHTLRWDFHEVKPEWLDAVDFIYSNSFDHTYDPEKCLNAWMSCIRPRGVCVLEHTSGHEPAGTSELDPFGAELALMPYLVATWSKGRYGVCDILDAPKRREDTAFVRFLVLRRF